MKKGAMPVPYIVAIILAVIIIGLLGYWLIVELNIFNIYSSEELCRAKIMGACANKPSDYNIDPYKYNQCKGTELAKVVSTCADVI